MIGIASNIGGAGYPAPLGEHMTADESFPLLIWSGLFKEKHWKKMGNAIWLFGMLIDKVTREEDSKGYVLGGAPVTYQTFQKEMPITKRQYLRYLDILREGDYIHTRNTHHGLSIVINKSKKFRRKSDKKVTAPTTKKSPASDKKGTSEVTDLSPPLRDSTVNTKETKSEVPDYLQLWSAIHKVFGLPEKAHTGYRADLVATINRLGFDVAMKAARVFVQNEDEHPPDGRVKSISSLLYWKKIDEYVMMIPPEKKLRYYTCRECGRIAQIENHPRIDEQMEMVGSQCHEQVMLNVTAAVKDCVSKGMGKNQIKTVINKLIADKQQEGTDAYLSN